MMQEWVASVIGALAGASALTVAAALLGSMPVVFYVAFQVVIRREWVPLTYNLRSLMRRKVSTFASFFGVALVVFVVTSVLMLAAGIQNTLASTGDPMNVKVLRKSVTTEGQSWLDDEQIQLLAANEHVARSGEGKPLFSRELVVVVWASHAGSSDPDDGANLSVRGVYPEAFVLHSPRRLEGRMFNAGTDEIVIGQWLVGRFDGAHLDGVMRFAGREWHVVGVADHRDTAHGSEIWGDFEQMSITFRRGAGSVSFALTDRDAFSTLSDRLASDPKLRGLGARWEAEYWESLGGNYVEFVQLLGSLVGLIFAFGAILGAMNTMYAQVVARTRELGTLRAIGFKPRAVLTSMVFESVVLALAAGGAGILAASLLAGTQFTLTTATTLTEIVYGFHLSPAIAVGSLGFASLIGYAGGLLPALRAARMPITDAVRAD
jgi:putative ABC transport system permease protein